MIPAVQEPPGRNAFALTANPDVYVPSFALERARERARRALETGHVPVIAGPAGLGKTLLLQLLARDLAHRFTPLYVFFTDFSPRELARLVLGLLERESEGDPAATVLDEVRRLHASRRPLLLLVDDASSLPAESAREIADWVGRAGGALDVVLAGLPGDALRAAARPFGESAVEVPLVEGLRPEEVAPFVEARLANAEAPPALRARFDDTTLGDLARVSGGNPRKLSLAAQRVASVPLSDAEIAAAEPEGARARASGADEATPPRPAPATRPPPRWESDGVGEYRIVRRRVAAPKTPARPASAAPEPRGGPSLAAPGEGRPDASTAEPAARDGSGEGAETAPTPPPAASDTSRLRWIAAAVAALAFGFGVATQLGLPLEGSRAPDAAPAGSETRAPRTEVRSLAPGPKAAGTPETPPATATRDTGAQPADAGAGPGTAPAAIGAEVATREATPADVATQETVAAPPEAAAAPAVATAEPVAEAAAEEPAGDEALPAEAVAGEAVAAGAGAESPPGAVASDATAPEPPAATASVGDADEAAPEPTPAPAETVEVSINATPWATIEIDGVEVGETPLAGIELEVGPHRFLARMPDGTLRGRMVEIDAENDRVVFE